MCLCNAVYAAEQGLDAQAEIDFSQIDSDYDIGHFEESLWALQDLQQAQPNHGAVLYRIGLAQEAMLDFDAARTAYTQAATKMMAPFLAYVHLGKLLQRMTQHTPAIAAFKQAMKLKPDSASTSYLLGSAHMDVGEFPAAVQAFKRTAEVDTAFEQKGLYGQGVSYLRMGKYEQAQTLLDEAIAIDPESEVASLAKKGLAAAVKIANTSYFSYFGLYGLQFDSNVVLKPSTSPNVPLITGESDVEHTLLGVVNYAPPPVDGRGYKASARVYQLSHAKLSTFDITDFGVTATPYWAVDEENLLFVDVSTDHILFNYKPYMNMINITPTWTYTPNKQVQLIASISGSREKYFLPVLAATSNQDSVVLTEKVQLFTFSEDRKYSMHAGAHYTVNEARGNDWSYHGYGGEAGVDAALPYVDQLKASVNGSIYRNRYQNLIVGETVLRRDISYNAALALSYPVNGYHLSATGSYTHTISTIEINSYVRVMAGITISRSF